MKISVETYISNHCTILQPSGLRRQQSALAREDTLFWSFDKRTMDVYQTMVVRIIQSHVKILVIIFYPGHSKRHTNQFVLLSSPWTLLLSGSKVEHGYMVYIQKASEVHTWRLPD